jgi:hypothetical protein
MENYSLNSKGIKQAATELINDNATSLIEYIYKRAGILDEDPIDSYVLIPGSQKDENDDKDEKDEKDEKADKEKADKEKDKADKADKEKADRDKDKEKKKNSIFQNVEVRIGLCIRILAKTNRYYDEKLINLILDDIEYLRKESDYLLSFKDPKARKAALNEEYALVQGFIDMDDTISLNQDSDTASKVGRLASDGQCVIQ